MDTDYEIYINVYNASLVKSADELDSVYYNNSMYFQQEMIEVYHKKATFNHFYEFEIKKPCKDVYVHVIMFAEFHNSIHNQRIVQFVYLGVLGSSILFSTVIIF